MKTIKKAKNINDDEKIGTENRCKQNKTKNRSNEIVSTLPMLPYETAHVLIPVVLRWWFE